MKLTILRSIQLSFLILYSALQFQFLPSPLSKMALLWEKNSHWAQTVEATQLFIKQGFFSIQQDAISLKVSQVFAHKSTFPLLSATTNIFVSSPKSILLLLGVLTLFYYLGLHLLAKWSIKDPKFQIFSFTMGLFVWNQNTLSNPDLAIAVAFTPWILREIHRWHILRKSQSLLHLAIISTILISEGLWSPLLILSTLLTWSAFKIQVIKTFSVFKPFQVSTKMFSDQQIDISFTNIILFILSLIISLFLLQPQTIHLKEFSQDIFLVIAQSFSLKFNISIKDLGTLIFITPILTMCLIFLIVSLYRAQKNLSLFLIPILLTVTALALFFQPTSTHEWSNSHFISGVLFLYIYLITNMTSGMRQVQKSKIAQWGLLRIWMLASLGLATGLAIKFFFTWKLKNLLPEKILSAQQGKMILFLFLLTLGCLLIYGLSEHKLWKKRTLNKIFFSVMTLMIFIAYFSILPFQNFPFHASHNLQSQSFNPQSQLAKPLQTPFNQRRISNTETLSRALFLGPKQDLDRLKLSLVPNDFEISIVDIQSIQNKPRFELIDSSSIIEQLTLWGPIFNFDFVFVSPSNEFSNSLNDLIQRSELIKIQSPADFKFLIYKTNYSSHDPYLSRRFSSATSEADALSALQRRRDELFPTVIEPRSAMPSRSESEWSQRVSQITAQGGFSQTILPQISKTHIEGLKVEASVISPQSGLIVWRQHFDAQWILHINDKPETFYRADLINTAHFIQAGENRIRWTYSKPIQKQMLILLITLIGIWILLAYRGGRTRGL